MWHYPAIPAIYIKKKQARKKPDDDKTPKSTNPHPFGALIDDYIDDQNLDLYFKKSRNTSGRNTTRKYASQHNPTCKTKKNQERVTVNAQIV